MNDTNTIEPFETLVDSGMGILIIIAFIVLVGLIAHWVQVVKEKRNG